MNFKTLTKHAGKLVLAGALAGSALVLKPVSTGSGKIGDEYLQFRSDILGESLIVTNHINETKVHYLDNSDFNTQLDSIKIYNKNGYVGTYHNDAVGRTVLEEGQKRFDEYKARMRESGLIKTLAVFEDLKQEQSEVQTWEK